MGNVVVSYVYDAWGKVYSVTGSMADTLGQINPIRYRSYYYDNETGFYYLNSRYYDPDVKRFINADGQLNNNQSLFGGNLFAYCYNNPVNMVDFDGNTPYPGYYILSGSRGDNVTSVQQSLINAGFSCGPCGVDGKFGKDTKAAVKAFQRSQGIGVDGIVGPITWGRLFSTSSSGPMDVTAAFLKALLRDAYMYSGSRYDIRFFISKVNHGARWDIKMKKSWEGTLGLPWPGSYNSIVIFAGKPVTPEILGNMAYGFLGTALGFSPNVLLWGGDYAAAGNSIIGIFTSADSISDKQAILAGIRLYSN